MCVACVPGLLSALQSSSSQSLQSFVAESVRPMGAAGGIPLNSENPAQNDDVPELTAAVTIHTARKIVTMERNNPTATAVAVLGKRIVAVGSLDQVKAALGTSAYRVNDALKDKIVMPGFIDQHLHPVLGALTLAVEVIATEDWRLPGRTWKAAESQSEYLGRLSAAEARLKDPNEWLLTWGYHPLWHGKLDRETLDAVSSTRPIAVWHRSCHEFFFNARGLEALGRTENMTKGKGLWSEQVNWDEGHFWEGGLNFVMGPMIKVLATPERLSFGLKQLVAYLHANGVTAYNEPGALFTPDMWILYEDILGAPETPMYATFLADGRGIPDRVGLARALEATEEQIAVSPAGPGKKLMLFPKQIKLFADGAIVSQLMQMKDGYLDGHQGAWIIAPEEFEKRARLYWNAGYQIHTHVNGDLGLEVVLDVLEKLMAESPRPDHRSVIVHFANSNEEQVGRIARLGALVSANPYYPVGFADKFGEVGLGPERADAMVRANSVLNHCIRLSFHSDLPIAPAAPLNFVWCAVNRITPSGRIAEPEQRVTVDDAFRAVTIEAAYSWRQEDQIGSIAPGKIANLTVLDDDPYSVPPMKLRDVPIWGTMFEGRLFPNCIL